VKKYNLFSQVSIFLLFVTGCSSLKQSEHKERPQIGQKLGILMEFLAHTPAPDVAVNDESEAALYKDLHARYGSLIPFNQVLKANGNWVTKSNPRRHVLVCSFGACSKTKATSVGNGNHMETSDTMICMFRTEAVEREGKVYRAHFKLVDNVYKLVKLELAAIL
jgi:hypothetical protein